MTVSREENPRQKLLEVIADKGPITIKDLRQITGMSVGSLYHHLSKLEQYITQDEQKRYLLSPQGKEFFQSQSILQVQNIPLYSSFIMPALRNKYSSMVTIIAVLQLYVLLYTNSSQLLFLPVKHGSVIESVGLGLVLSILLAEALSIAVGARAGYGMLGLAAGISISTVPIASLAIIDNVYATMALYTVAVFIASATISSAKNLSYLSSVAVALSILLVSIALFLAGFGAMIAIPIAITIALIVLARQGVF
ncbi:MAG: winged helix-turn-helix transcriptional regulator [Nitrososphaerales archaeon]